MLSKILCILLDGLLLDFSYFHFLSLAAPQLEFFNYTALENGRAILFQWRLLHNGGAPVSSFRITLQSDNMAERSQDLNVDDNRVLMTGLEPNTTYRVAVTLSNQLGGATPINLEITTPPGKWTHILYPVKS